MMETTREIYLDNSATTKVCEEAAKAALELMTVCYGNPSSLHTMGVRAETAMTRARRIVAQAMGAQEKNIVFTSGGTESNNLALVWARPMPAKNGANGSSRQPWNIIRFCIQRSSLKKRALKSSISSPDATAYPRGRRI